MGDSEMVVVTAVMRFKGAAEGPVREALERLAAATRREPGCLEYSLHVRNGAPAEVFIYERWRDSAALDRHGSSPHLAEFRANMAEHFAKPSSVSLWRKLG
jgi:quinol monooxygenase YgiN